MPISIFDPLREFPPTATGFIPTGTGPWPAGDHDEDPGFGPMDRYHGNYLIEDPQGSVIGQLLVVPEEYKPLANTQWIEREYWRWATGQAWPDKFRLIPISTELGSGSFGAWTSWAHVQLAAPPATVEPDASQGKLYKLTRYENGTGTSVGLLWRRPSGEMEWYGIDGQVDDGYLAVSTQHQLEFEQISTVPQGWASCHHASAGAGS